MTRIENQIFQNVAIIYVPWLNIIYFNFVNYLSHLICSQEFSSCLTNNVDKQSLFVYKRKEYRQLELFNVKLQFILRSTWSPPS